YVERYFLSESVQNGWTCPEALELHKLFQFLNRHRHASKVNPPGPAVSYIQGWRDSISAIRHAAVHRLAQDRQSLLRMTRAAIGFVQCMSGSSHTQSLRRLRKYLRVALPRPSRRSVVPRRQARFQTCRVENGLSHSSHPSITLPEPLQGILSPCRERLLPRASYSRPYGPGFAICAQSRVPRLYTYVMVRAQPFTRLLFGWWFGRPTPMRPRRA
ncbi:hypothetical protein F1880_008412, partial [Penicillium rolfsii]